ncbi:ATP-binding protein [Streptomyces sp. NPDC028722]|uniref:ATP-binding protein n=1 Tax=Streptomyces sp. NPDC028722 TaxID=3155016 RepID=UPI0033CF4E45
MRESSPIARYFVRGVLRGWGLAGRVEDDAALVVTELVNNAVRHARTPSLRVTVCRTTVSTIRLGVIDLVPARLPVLRKPSEWDISGRGLAMVDVLARNWGYSRSPWAKCVWAELEVPDAS